MLFAVFIIISGFEEENSLSLEGITAYYYEIEVPAREQDFTGWGCVYRVAGYGRRMKRAETDWRFV